MSASGGESQGVEELVEDSWERMLQEETQANGPQVCSNGIISNDTAYNHPQAHTWVAVPGRMEQQVSPVTTMRSLLEDLIDQVVGTSETRNNGEDEAVTEDSSLGMEQLDR